MFSSPIAILFTTVALDLIGFGMVVPLMPLYARQYAVSPQAIAWLLASYSLMQFFFAPVWGKLSDRLGRRPVLLASMAGNFVALMAFATAHSFAQLLISRLIAGICTANIAVASAYIADSTEPKSRAKGMGLIGAAFGLGFVLGPFFAGELSQWGLRAPPYVAAALALGNGLLAFVRLPESLPAHLRAEPGSRTVSLRPWQLLLARWRRARLQPRVLQLVALVFGHVFGFAMMEMALTLMMAQRFGFGAQQSGRLLAFVGVVLVVVQGGAVGRLSRRFGDGPLFVTGLFLMGAGLCATAFTASAAVGLGPVLVALAALATGQGLVAPTGAALLSQSAGSHEQGEVLGFGQSSSALARVCGPVAAGVLFQHSGDLAPFYAGGAVVFAAACAAQLWLSRARRLKSQNPQQGHPCQSHP